MKPSTEQVLVSYLQKALDSEHGLELIFGDDAGALFFRRKLYEARRKHTPAYSSLSFLQVNGSGLWIIKRTEVHADPFEVEA